MERLELKDYLNVEIPALNGTRGIRRFICLCKAVLLYPSYNALFLLRYCYVNQNANGLKKWFKIYCRNKLISNYGIFFEIEGNAHIGIGLQLPHPSSIVFGAGVHIGDNCVIYQNVTFGAKKRNDEHITSNRYPIIGNDCVFYAGSVILGPISVSNGTQVGANAVLLSDTEESSVYAGVPAIRK